MIFRAAKPSDAGDMVNVLNPIITKGGTTAHQRPFDAARMLHHYIAPDDQVSCVVAEEAGVVIGFQSLVWPNAQGDAFPEGWTIIASFVAPEAAGKGVGQGLFSATIATARTAGVKTIDATIRADNEAGLRYYSGLGFVDYDRLRDVPLRDGRTVDRVRKRFDLIGDDG